jgi:hypothetical protein
MVNEAKVACALERHRLQNSQFPPTLEALCPAFISKLPHDLITGKPFLYRLQEDGGFLLYSVGWDGLDDGGSPASSSARGAKGDWVWAAEE